MSDDKKAAPNQAAKSGEASSGEGESGAVKPIVRRRVAKSAATAERPTYQDVPEAPPASTESGGAPPGRSADELGLPSTISAPEGAPASADSPTSGTASGPASSPRPDSRGTGRSADGRWDMRAPPRSGPRPGFRGAPRGDDGGFRRPGASGGRATPFIPQRDAEGNPIAERPRFRSDRPAGEGAPSGDRPDRGPRPPRGPRPDGGRRFDGPRPPRAEGPRPEGAGAEGGRPERRERRDDRPRGDGPRPPRGERPAARLERPAQRETPQPPPPPKKEKTVAETILLGLPKAKLDAQNAKDAQKPKTAKEALRAKTLGRDAAPKAKPADAPPAAIELEKSWLASGAEGAKAAVDAAGPSAEKLVEAWIKGQNAAALVEIEARDDVPGPVRKAAKRGVFALKSKGVAIPERRSAVQAPKASEQDAWEATFLPPDGRGSVAFTIAKKLSDGRLQVAEVIAREPQGVVQAASAWLSRTQLREGHQRAQSRAGIAPVAVPVAWARMRIAEALKLNGTSGTLLPLGLDRCRELIEPAPDSAEHPIAALEAGLAADAAPAAAALHNEPEFRGWLPEAPAIDEMLRKLGESLGEGGAKDPEKVSKGLDDEVKNATDRYFSPEVRGVVASRLRDAAVSVRARAGEDKAKEVVATARAVEQAGLITSPPRDVAFLAAFFHKAVALLLQKGSGSLRIPMAQAPAAG